MLTEMTTCSSNKSEIELLQSSDLQRGDFSLTYILIINEFWKIVKSFTPTENTIPTLSSGSIVATTNPQKAWLLNATFTNCLNYSLPGLNVAEAVPHECPEIFMYTEDEFYVPLIAIRYLLECLRRLH